MEKVIIALTYEDYNWLDIIAEDIHNEYLAKPTTDNNFIFCGPDFGSDNIERK